MCWSHSKAGDWKWWPPSDRELRGWGLPQDRHLKAGPLPATTPVRSRAGREHLGTVPAVIIEHLLGDRVGPRNSRLAHGWRSVSWPVRETRVRCSHRMSEAIKIVQGSQSDGKILPLYQNSISHILVLLFFCVFLIYKASVRVFVLGKHWGCIVS